MKKIRCYMLAVALSLPMAATAAPDSNELEQEARELARQYIDTIKPALKGAMAEGGPALAIEICTSIAPRVAGALSAESGWMIRRVSLKQRNASRAVPDAWEQEVLEDFDERKAGGAAAPELVRAEIVGPEYRYMQAQLAEEICMNCHGTELPHAARVALSEYYPDDAATGYKVGDVRGAISLRKNYPRETPDPM